MNLKVTGGLIGTLFLASALFAEKKSEQSDQDYRSKVERLNDGLKIADKALVVATWTARVESIRKGSEVMGKLGGSLGALGTRSGELATGIDKALSMRDAKERKEAASKAEPMLLKSLKAMVDPASAVRELRKEVDALEFSLVSEGDERFRVSFDDFKRNPDASAAKLKALANSLATNIDGMKQQRGVLEELERRSKGASKVLQKLSDSLIKATQDGAGIFGELVAYKAFDASELAVDCNSVATSASRRIKELDRASKGETDRLELLKSNYRILFGRAI